MPPWQRPSAEQTGQMSSCRRKESDHEDSARRLCNLCALAPVANANLAAAQSPGPHAVDTVRPGEFPAVGKSYDVDFGNQQFRLDFLSETEMRFTSPDGKNTDIVKVTVTRIRPEVFMVYWSRRPGQHALHVQDYGSQVAYTNIFLQDGTATRAKGPLTPVK